VSAAGWALSDRPFARIGRPAAAAAAAAAAVGYIAVVSPDVPGHYPTCPFYALTGYYCPGCGSLRAIHALVHGHVAQAFGYNVLAMSMLPVLGYIWVTWLTRSVRGRPKTALAQPAWIWGFAVLVVMFWVFRNTPPGHFLAPTGHL
jgi:hypothetical protein